MIQKKKPHINRKLRVLEKTKVPERLKKQAFEYFSVKETVTKLGITQKFLRNLNENTKVLEIGSGSGRFADFLLRKTKLQPKNLELMDMQFDKKDLPFLKSLIYKLNNKEKITLTKGNLFEHNYKKNMIMFLFQTLFLAL